MKILIICDMFPPAFGPRMGYLCKYMQKAGWSPTVITEQIPNQTFEFLCGDIPVIYISYYKAKGKVLKKLEWIGIQILDLFFKYKDRKLIQTANQTLKAGGFSGVLCSTYRTFPLTAAQQVAHKHDLPFIADLRDIIEQYASDEYITHLFKSIPWLDKKITHFFKSKLLQRRNKVLRKANCITTVSPWHVETLKQYNPVIHLIYNGYDPELFYPQQLKSNQFIMVYTGRLISLATRDPHLLFKAIARLDKEKRISPLEFQLHWYMDKMSNEILKQLAEEYQISPYMHYFGYVPATQIPAILNQSSILIQLANKMDKSGPKGIMTTKLFESLAVEKPLLCVRSDEAYLEAIIKETHSGIAARSEEDVYQFILEYYRLWKEKGYTSIQIKKDAIELFSRKRQAKQFMDLFTQLKKDISHG